MMERIREQSQTLDNRIAELKSTVAGTGEQIDRMTTLTAEARTAAFDLSFNLAQVQQHAELAEAIERSWKERRPIDLPLTLDPDPEKHP